MDLKTSYLGLQLAHPLMAGASPLVDDMGMVKRLEDAGASGIVMHSLFEEQITREEQGTLMDMELHANSNAEAVSYFPQPDDFRLGPERYLEQLRRIKEAVAVPVIASLNGTTAAGWLHYAQLMEQAGADALELNVYYIATDAKESAADVEKRTLDVVRTVKAQVKIPVAVKLSPFFSSLAHFAGELEAAGADGLVLFNRFFQPDINVEELLAEPSLQLSGPSDLLLRLRWLAVLHGRIKGSLAVTGGVHDGIGAPEGRHGRCRRRPDGVRPADPRARAAGPDPRDPGRVAGGARVRVPGPGPGQHEPPEEPESPGLHPRQLHADPQRVEALSSRQP